MSDLRDLVAVRLRGATLSLHDVLSVCKAQGKLAGLLREAVEGRLVSEYAARQGIVVSDDDLQRAADAFRQSHRLQKAEATHAWLTEQHLTLLDLQTRLERQLLRRKVMERVVTQEEVERHFVENRQHFDRAVLSQLVAERQGVAEELLTQVREDGADFGALARKHSLHRESRQAGGFLGVVSRTALTPAVEAAVFGAAAGSVLGPFQTPLGWALVRVEELLPAVLDAAVGERIREYLFRKWLDGQIKGADVQWTLFDLLT
jgi:parvulin-like peptidyl-prolyl isomerase